MPSNNPIFLYSTNTFLAYSIAEQYYRGIHWVWCSPYFRPKGGPPSVTMPISAIPGSIYERLYKDVTSDDHHSFLIKRNKVGLRKGIAAKLASGVITPNDALALESAIRRANLKDFRPMLYIIPFTKVKRLLVEVDVKERAHPLSVEYKIEALSSGSFEAIELLEV
jgi:hypothetical protein